LPIPKPEGYRLWPSRDKVPMAAVSLECVIRLCSGAHEENLTGINENDSADEHAHYWSPGRIALPQITIAARVYCRSSNVAKLRRQRPAR
jgi:hypothetical protein